MAGSWIMTGNGIADKIGSATHLSNHVIGESVKRAYVECPKCQYHIHTSTCMKVDGSSRYFFHSVSNAYKSGTRIKRKVEEHIRWRKSGESKAIHDDDGVIRGWKKILVLVEDAKNVGHNKNEWVMHQYGLEKDEKAGGLLVSKVFYQSSKRTGKPLSVKKSGKSHMNVAAVEHEASIVKNDSGTQGKDPTQPHGWHDSPYETEQHAPMQLDQGKELSGTSIFQQEDEEAQYTAWFTEQLQAGEDVDRHDWDEHDATRTWNQAPESYMASDVNFREYFGDAENVTTAQAWTRVLKSDKEIGDSDVREPPKCDAVHGFPDLNDPLCFETPPDLGTSPFSEVQETCPEEMVVPPDGYNMAAVHGLPDLGTSSLADIEIGSSESIKALLASFY
ncbi:hypothetical protein ACP4OV_011246 [Aristida adscensionis]